MVIIVMLQKPNNRFEASSLFFFCSHTSDANKFRTPWKSFNFPFSFFRSCLKKVEVNYKLLEKKIESFEKCHKFFKRDDKNVLITNIYAMVDAYLSLGRQVSKTWRNSSVPMSNSWTNHTGTPIKIQSGYVIEILKCLSIFRSGAPIPWWVGSPRPWQC